MWRERGGEERRRERGRWEKRATVEVKVTVTVNGQARSECECIHGRSEFDRLREKWTSPRSFLLPQFTSCIVPHKYTLYTLHTPSLLELLLIHPSLLYSPYRDAMPPVEPPQLRFLSDAANLLGSSSPSTAAHLLTAHTHILHDGSKSLNARQNKHHCAGCGSLRISKASKPTVVKSRKKPRTAIRGTATVHKCVRCNQRAVISRKRSVPRATSKASSRVPTATAVDSAASTASTPSISSQQDLPAIASSSTEKTLDNASSKKRAKARKQGGLQALLASKKSTEPSLNLLDFLS